MNPDKRRPRSFRINESERRAIIQLLDRLRGGKLPEGRPKTTTKEKQQ